MGIDPIRIESEFGTTTQRQALEQVCRRTGNVADFQFEFGVEAMVTDIDPGADRILFAAQVSASS